MQSVTMYRNDTVQINRLAFERLYSGPDILPAPANDAFIGRVDDEQAGGGILAGNPADRIRRAVHQRHAPVDFFIGGKIPCLAGRIAGTGKFCRKQIGFSHALQHFTVFRPHTHGKISRRLTQAVSNYGRGRDAEMRHQLGDHRSVYHLTVNHYQRIGDDFLVGRFLPAGLPRNPPGDIIFRQQLGL